jgi:serine protease AprX
VTAALKTRHRTRRETILVAATLAAVLSLAGSPTAARGLVWERAASTVTNALHGAPAGPHGLDPGIDASSVAQVRVVVQAADGDVAAAAKAVQAAGGTVGAALPIVNGFEATLSGMASAVVATSSAVRAVTLDRTGSFEATGSGDFAAPSAFTRSTGATTAWSQRNRGEGVGVAVIDTGISPMADLAPRVVYGPDLSGEGTIIDTYGHGTVMAGAIAGNGADSAGSSKGAYMGMAPNAHLVAVKVAGRNGAADVSTILQAMHWVAAYKAQYGIRVVNLSWGTASTQSPSVDPLNYAVERLWSLGIVVVVAAGNSGPGLSTITKPADDPLVITAGAYADGQDTSLSNDQIPDWSSRGPTAAGLAKPDLVAPGRTIITTRSLGSYVEGANPKALVGNSYIKGSGTSQAAAVTSGAAALILAVHPDYSPDQVKAVMTGTAQPLANTPRREQGAGRLQVAAALTAAPGPATTQRPVSNGLGSLESSRGGAHVDVICGGTVTTVQGEIDAQCQPWDGASWTGASWTGASWTGASWTGGSWTGGSWTGGSWTGASWTGASWTGASWTGASWTGGSWTGASWTGASWTGASWTGASWTGASWTGASWTGGSWTGASWTTAEYEDAAESQLLTAFWGDHPRAGKHVEGERSDDWSSRRPRWV